MSLVNIDDPTHQKTGIPVFPSDVPERTFTLAEALEIAKYFEARGMDIMTQAEWGDFSKTMDVNTYFKEKFNIDLNK